MSTRARSGVVTITTDFGHKGPFVGTMKGQILRRFPEAKLIDLTHDTLVHWPDEAGFWISRSYRYFPDGTVHLAVVDPGVGTRRDILLLERDGHLFLAPDNGLLAPLATAPAARHWHLDLARLGELGIADPSATFHGRDIFAPVAAELAAGRREPASLGTPVERVVPAWLDEPTVGEGQVSGLVVTTDHFGNLITNIERTLVEALGEVAVLAAGRRMELRRTYGDVEPGTCLALINSFDVLEIACAEGSAAEGLGLGRGAPVIVRAAGG